jgi:predicted O-linked N-acetylglucosamine transferase (SPINDLY family)
MGVPVVTWASDRPVGRQSAAILNTIGTQELIAPNPAEYVKLATTLAQDRAQLQNYKQQLRTRMAHSPLVDAAGYTRAFEQVLRNIAENKL